MHPVSILIEPAVHGIRYGHDCFQNMQHCCVGTACLLVTLCHVSHSDAAWNCSWERWELCAQFWQETTKGKGSLGVEDLGVNGRIIGDNLGKVQVIRAVAYREGGVWGVHPPPKFRRYRWSPRSHKQVEPASRFPFAVHCVLIRCNLLNKGFF